MERISEISWRPGNKSYPGILQKQDQAGKTFQHKAVTAETGWFNGRERADAVWNPGRDYSIPRKYSTGLSIANRNNTAFVSGSDVRS